MLGWVKEITENKAIVLLSASVTGTISLFDSLAEMIPGLNKVSLMFVFIGWVIITMLTVHSHWRRKDSSFKEMLSMVSIYTFILICLNFIELLSQFKQSHWMISMSSWIVVFFYFAIFLYELNQIADNHKTNYNRDHFILKYVPKLLQWLDSRFEKKFKASGDPDPNLEPYEDLDKEQD